MAGALSRYGETADDLESGLRDCARRLGVDAEFFATPTAVFASFGPSGVQRRPCSCARGKRASTFRA